MSGARKTESVPVENGICQCSERTRLIQNGTGVKEDTEGSALVQLRTYRIRWFVLLIFWLHMLVNNWMWITFGSIADLVACYYDVSLFWVNTLSWVFMLVYVLGFLPTIYFLNHYGLKVTGFVAASTNAMGAWLRFMGSGESGQHSSRFTGRKNQVLLLVCFSGSGYFWFVLAGHIVASFANLLEWGAGSYVAAIWFPPSERAFATAAISSQGEQVGY